MTSSALKLRISKRSSKTSTVDEELFKLLDSNKNFKKCMDKWIQDQANDQQIRILHDCGVETKEITTTWDCFEKLVKDLELPKRVPKEKEYDDLMTKLKEYEDDSEDINIKDQLEELRSFPNKILSLSKSEKELDSRIKGAKLNKNLAKYLSRSSCKEVYKNYDKRLNSLLSTQDLPLPANEEKDYYKDYEKRLSHLLSTQDVPLQTNKEKDDYE